MQHFFRNVGWKSKYDIEFKGLAEGRHLFDFEVDDSFFAHFENSQVDKGKVHAAVDLEKRSAFLKLNFSIRGKVELTCDRCLDRYMQKIKHKTEMFVKFGDEAAEEGENVIWVLPEEHHINLAQLIYEFIILGIPLRHIHPKDKNGERGCDREMLKKLKDYKASGSGEEPFSDPRWDALKNLGNNN